MYVAGVWIHVYSTTVDLLWVDGHRGRLVLPFGRIASGCLTAVEYLHKVFVAEYYHYSLMYQYLHMRWIVHVRTH